MRRTKIICTIGPASESIEKLRELIQLGMNVARLNFSHGNHEEHAGRIKNIREAAKLEERAVAIMLDTKGPEIRTGQLKEDKVLLNEGQNFTLTTEEIMGDSQRVSVSYSGLPQDIGVGSTILLDDGLIALKVENINGANIECKVVNSGELGSKKGVNVPGRTINLPAITDKDIQDINFGINQGLDFIAASFVRKASDVIEIRRLLENQDANLHIIAKIESHEGVHNINEIIKVSDGIMVARGDLGVEIPTEEVPLVQKRIIEKCNLAGKPVITATQMLDSMIRNPRPTRAEATDIANAIFDGTDAIMLSGETAAGKYPIEAITTMAKIAIRTEKALHFEEILDRKRLTPLKTVTDAISHASVTTAQDLGATAVITSTKSGHTARMVSKYRPKSPIIAVTPLEDVQRKLLLIWGVEPILVSETEGTDEMIDVAVEKALETHLIKCGDLVVITAGVPVGIPGTTNLIKVHIVGNVMVRGTGIGHQAVTGSVKIINQPTEDKDKFNQGDILVSNSTDRDFVPLMEKASAIITEEGGLTSHAAIVGLNLGIPVVVGVGGATNILKDGNTITIDTPRGLIYKGIIKIK